MRYIAILLTLILTSPAYSAMVIRGSGGGGTTTEWIYWNSNNDVSGTGYTTDNEMVGDCLAISVTGNISKIGWRAYSGNSWTGASVDVALYDCDTGDTCTKIQEFTSTSVSGGTWVDHTLTSARSVTSGDTVCVAYIPQSSVEIAYSSGSSGIYQSSTTTLPASFSKSGVSSDHCASRVEVNY